MASAQQIWQIEIVKLTVEIPDALFRQASAYSARHNVALQEVFEKAVRQMTESSRGPAKRFRLKTITTKGDGLVSGDDWPFVRARIYEGRGA